MTLAEFLIWAKNTKGHTEQSAKEWWQEMIDDEFETDNKGRDNEERLWVPVKEQRVKKRTRDIEDGVEESGDKVKAPTEEDAQDMKDNLEKQKLRFGDAWLQGERRRSRAAASSTTAPLSSPGKRRRTDDQQRSENCDGAADRLVDVEGESLSFLAAMRRDLSQCSKSVAAAIASAKKATDKLDSDQDIKTDEAAQRFAASLDFRVSVCQLWSGTLKKRTGKGEVPSFKELFEANPKRLPVQNTEALKTQAAMEELAGVDGHNSEEELSTAKKEWDETVKAAQQLCTNTVKSASDLLSHMKVVGRDKAREKKKATKAAAQESEVAKAAKVEMEASAVQKESCAPLPLFMGDSLHSDSSLGIARYDADFTEATVLDWRRPFFAEGVGDHQRGPCQDKRKFL